MDKNKGRLFGAHMPIAGGVENAPLSGARTGCAAMQIFTKNSNQWRANGLTDAGIAAYRENLEKSGILFVASHDSYLINLGSPDAAMRGKSLAAFIDEVERAARLGIGHLVFHPGSHMGAGEEEGLELVGACMNEAIKKTAHCPGVKLTIETTAGQGTNLGWRFWHLGRLIGMVKDKKRVAVCFDTCHVFAAGYNIRTPEGYKAAFKEFDNEVGLEHLAMFHINDSKKDLGSRVDRHEHIGKGFLGKAPFSLLVNDRRFAKTPMVLETPKGKDLAEDIENLSVLRSLVE